MLATYREDRSSDSCKGNNGRRLKLVGNKLLMFNTTYINSSIERKRELYNNASIAFATGLLN